MGISRGWIKLFMMEGKREKFIGNMLTAGRQDIFSTADNLYKWAKEMDYNLKRNMEVTFSDKKELQSDNFISDNTFFSALGFDNIDSLDYSDFEQCTIVHDLNKDVPADLYNRYDLIYDGGTSEHVFNFPKVLENYNRMLKVGGRIIHALPSSNFVDHGFYMFSPTVFVDYYASNKWDIINTFFIKHSFKNNKISIYSYEPSCFSRYSFGGFNKGMYEVFFVARKTDNSTFTASVQQGNYLRRWNISVQEKQVASNSTNSLLIKKISNLLPSKIRDKVRPYYCQLIFKLPLKNYLKFVAKY